MTSARVGKGRAKPAAHSAQGGSPWEWAVAVVGLVLLVAAIGYLAWFAVTVPDGPPAVTVEQGPVRRSGDGYLAIVIVHNQGAETAAALEIEGTLHRDGAVVETSTATFDYLPRFSERTGGLFFATDPRTGRLELRAKGYAEP